MKKILALVVLTALAVAQNAPAPAIDYGDAARAAAVLRQLQNLKAPATNSPLVNLATQLNLKAQTDFAAAEYFLAGKRAQAALKIHAALRASELKSDRDGQKADPRNQAGQDQKGQDQKGQDQKGQDQKDQRGQMGQDQRGQGRMGQMAPGRMVPGRMGNHQKAPTTQGRMGQMAPGRMAPMGQGMQRPGMAPQMRQMATPQIMAGRVADVIERAEKELAYYKGDDDARTLIEAARAAQKETPMVAALLAQAALDLISGARGF